MWLGQIHFIHIAVKDLFDDSTWLPFLLLLASEPIFDRTLCRIVSLLAAFTPVLLDASAEAVTCAPAGVLFDRIKAKSVEVKLEVGITYQDFGGLSIR